MKSLWQWSAETRLADGGGQVAPCIVWYRKAPVFSFFPLHVEDRHYVVLKMIKTYILFRRQERDVWYQTGYLCVWLPLRLATLYIWCMPWDQLTDMTFCKRAYVSRKFNLCVLKWKRQKEESVLGCNISLHSLTLRGQHMLKNPLMKESDSSEIEKRGWPLNDFWGKIYSLYIDLYIKEHSWFDFNQHFYMHVLLNSNKALEVWNKVKSNSKAMWKMENRHLNAIRI